MVMPVCDGRCSHLTVNFMAPLTGCLAWASSFRQACSCWLAAFKIAACAALHISKGVQQIPGLFCFQDSAMLPCYSSLNFRQAASHPPKHQQPHSICAAQV